MNRFARVGEETFKRHAELHGEEFRLYTIIIFHLLPDSGCCAKNLREISETYGLDYNNTARRYKILRLKGWCENTRNGIRPLIGVYKKPE